MAMIMTTDCGHAHIPDASKLGDGWSYRKAASIAFAVGIRPCSGAVLVLLFANTLGLYAAGVGATFAMSLGTAITVSAIAVATVLFKNAATILARDRTAAGRPGCSAASPWLAHSLFWCSVSCC